MSEMHFFSSFTYFHLTDAFIQSDFQERAFSKMQVSTGCSKVCVCVAAEKALEVTSVMKMKTGSSSGSSESSSDSEDGPHRGTHTHTHT